VLWSEGGAATAKLTACLPCHHGHHRLVPWILRGCDYWLLGTGCLPTITAHPLGLEPPMSIQHSLKETREVCSFLMRIPASFGFFRHAVCI
jgi:hypothetical protein